MFRSVSGRLLPSPTAQKSAKSENEGKCEKEKLTNLFEKLFRGFGGEMSNKGWLRTVWLSDENLTGFFGGQTYGTINIINAAVRTTVAVVDLFLSPEENKCTVKGVEDIV